MYYHDKGQDMLLKKNYFLTQSISNVPMQKKELIAQLGMILLKLLEVKSKLPKDSEIAKGIANLADELGSLIDSLKSDPSIEKEVMSMLHEMCKILAEQIIESFLN